MPSPQTHRSRQPRKGVVGYIESGLSRAYAMAGTFWIPLDPYRDENPFGPDKPPKPKPKPIISISRAATRAAFGQAATGRFEHLSRRTEQRHGERDQEDRHAESPEAPHEQGDVPPRPGEKPRQLGGDERQRGNGKPGRGPVDSEEPVQWPVSPLVVRLSA